MNLPRQILAHKTIMKQLAQVAMAELILALIGQGGQAQSLTLTVDAERVVREGADHFVGI
jgi:hypothetical protein